MSLDDFLKSEFDWETDAYGVNITDYYGKGVNVVVPQIIDGKPVTSIGRWAFCGCSGLVSITIPDGVTRIGECVFLNCKGLISITIPSGVMGIWGKTFSGCSGLERITIPNSVEWIGERSFSVAAV